MKLKRMFGCLMCCMMAFSLFGCRSDSPEDESRLQNGIPKQLQLCTGDTYDFSALEMTVQNSRGTCLNIRENAIEAVSAGTATVAVKDESDTFYRYEVTVYDSARELGGKFELDRAMFAGKKAIVFGDSITDGYMGNESNYTQTYFALLCDYLGIANDPADILNSNFACGGSTLTYGLRQNFGISGVQRINETQPFHDTGRKRDPYSNIPDADLCVIFYGTNDFDENVPARADGHASLGDTPTRMEDALTIKGGAYYMIGRLHELNPRMKILMLPPLYRRKAGNLEYVKGDRNDVYNKITGEKLSEYGAAIKEAAAENGAKFIDWYPVFDFENFVITSQYTADGLHPNREGHRAMFEYLISHTEE